LRINVQPIRFLCKNCDFSTVKLYRILEQTQIEAIKNAKIPCPICNNPLDILIESMISIPIQNLIFDRNISRVNIDKIFIDLDALIRLGFLGEIKIRIFNDDIIFNVGINDVSFCVSKELKERIDEYWKQKK